MIEGERVRGPEDRHSHGVDLPACSQSFHETLRLIAADNVLTFFWCFDMDFAIAQ